MATDQKLRVGIVGGGLGGLAAACTLAARGHQAVLVERNNWLGGKAAEVRRDGYRFDMGPTILTMPQVLERIFAEAGRDLEEALDLVELDPQWRLFFDDGTRLDLHSDLEAMCGELAEFADGKDLPSGYRRFMESSEHLHQITDRYLFWESVGSVRDVMGEDDSGMLRTLWDMLHMRPGHTVAGTVRHYIPDERVAQMADHFTQYVGSSPYKAPAVLCGIAHIQTELGEWYPRGGIRTVPVALEVLARELGVEVRTGVEVRRILHDDGRASVLKLDGGETIEVDAVVSNSDVVLTHRELLGADVASAFGRRRSYEPACSGVVLLLGLKERYPHLLHHNFAFSRDPEQEFEAIYDQGRPAPDPTCYICAPSATDPSVAPEGGEALYVLVHTPHLRPAHNWHHMLPSYRESILNKLEKTAGLEDLRDRIVTMRALTPQDIRDRYHTLEGAIYGLASHGRLTGAFKPANRSEDVERLYFAGGSVNPGPGMPMALMSGWIAADCVDRDLG